MRHILFFLLSVLAVGSAVAEPAALARGQVWTFANAPTESARVVIGDVEPFGPDGLVAVSLSVTGLPGGMEIGHLPFNEAVLRGELLELQAETHQLGLAYAEGYSTWKQAVESEGAGIFTVPPSEVIESISRIAESAY